MNIISEFIILLIQVKNSSKRLILSLYFVNLVKFSCAKAGFGAGSPPRRRASRPALHNREGHGSALCTPHFILGRWLPHCEGIIKYTQAESRIVILHLPVRRQHVSWRQERFETWLAEREVGPAPLPGATTMPTHKYSSIWFLVSFYSPEAKILPQDIVF